MVPVFFAQLAFILPTTGAESGQSAFVHLFEWSWKDIAQECEDWLGPKGYRGVQVSPVTEHIKGLQWWTRYQPVTYNLTSRSGTPEEFAEMVKRCAAVNVEIIVDVVLNHVAGGSGVGIAGSTYGYRTTAIYSQEDFHHSPGNLGTNCGVSNFQDKYNVQYCDLEGLPDICTACPRVKTIIGDFLKSLVQMGVSGFRIDAGKHMDAGELKELLKDVNAKLIFIEVVEGYKEAVQPEMYYSIDIGKVTEFRYGSQLGPNILAEGKLKYLETFGENWGFMPNNSAVVFIDNHDTQRSNPLLTFKNGGLYTLANVFMLAHPYGYPKVMSSYNFDASDQGPPDAPVHGGAGSLGCFNGAWVCEHRYPEIANMIDWRRNAGSDPTLQVFQSSEDGNGAFFCRGSSACVALNRGDSSWNTTVKTTLSPGEYLNVMCRTTTCRNVMVDTDGSAYITVPSVGAVAFHHGSLVPVETTVTPPVVVGRRPKLLIFHVMFLSMIVVLILVLLVLATRAFFRHRRVTVRVIESRQRSPGDALL